jgi:mRNA interferase MazF
MKRGEIWWAEVDKRRPVVLISRDEAYPLRALVVAAGLTTKVRGYAVEVRVGRREGLSRDCVVNCDWLVTIGKDRLRERIGPLPAEKLRQLDEALRFALALDS